MSTETMFDTINDWKMERLGKFTSSEISKLMQKGKGKDEYFGKGAMTYIYETIAEIVTGETAPEILSNAIMHGHANEFEAIFEYDKKHSTATEYFGSGNPKFFPYNSVSGGSPDGILNNEILVEVKCPYNSANHIKILTINTQEELKDYSFEYYCQVQFNMLCTGLPVAHFLSYDPRVIDHKFRLAVIEVKQDDKLITELKERITAATEIVKTILLKLS